MPGLTLSSFLITFLEELIDASSHTWGKGCRTHTPAAPRVITTKSTGLSQALAFRKMVDIATCGGKVLVWTSQPDFAVHFSAVIAGIEIGRLKAPNLLDEDWLKMTELIEKSKHLRIHILVRSATPMKLLGSSIDEFTSTCHPSDALFIDLCMVSDWLSSQDQEELFLNPEPTERLKSIAGVRDSRIFTYC